MPKKITLDLSIRDLIALECILNPLAACADFEAEQLDALRLTISAQHARRMAAEARRLHAVLKAAGVTVRYEEAA